MEEVMLMCTVMEALGTGSETLGDWSVRTGDAVVTLGAVGDTLLVTSETTEDKSTIHGVQYSIYSCHSLL